MIPAVTCTDEPRDEAGDEAHPGAHPGALSTFGALAARVLSGPPRLGAVRMVGIDGPAGSGKTTLAGRLVTALGDATGDPVTLVHMDDLYPGWRGLQAAALDLVPRWLLEPLSAGEPGRWRRWDWHAGALAERHEVPASGVLVLEGCGSTARPSDPYTTLRIWVDAPVELRTARGMERDGAQVLPFWRAWQADEEEHFAADGTRARADLLVDGAAGSDDPGSGIVAVDPTAGELRSGRRGCR